MPEMSDQIQEGMVHLNMNERRLSVTSTSTRFASLFPVIHDRARNYPNVTPSDEEVERTLEEARLAVLTSNDADMQLAWAQDALLYCGTAMDNEERLQATHASRPGTPPIERQLKQDAMNVVGFLADQHHPQAEFMRGMWYEFGKFGVPQDKKEAFRCYSRAADKGCARAEYRIGMLYEAANDPIKALRHYHSGVDQNDSASLYRLGMMTLRGQHGQVKDYAKGLDLIRRSADRADENAPQGAYVYGMLLARQIPQISIPDGILHFDETAARHHIEVAAFLKFSKAQLKMGSAYELASLGCPFDPALSLHYNRLASTQGEPEADMAISKWFLVGHESLFPKNEEIAYTYANRAARTGLSNAEFAMGYFNELGVYVQRNLDVALEWYKKAAENGNPDAAGRIEGIARKKPVSREDHERNAVSMIRSQFGSQRATNGPKRDQFVKGHPPRGSSLSGGLRHDTPTLTQSPPYPLDDRPPTVPSGVQRPASAAPYPLDDTSSAHIVRASTVQPDRPGSGFSVSPEIRPMSTSTGPGPGPRPRYPSAMVGRSSPGPRMLDPGQRVVSTPMAMHPRPHSAVPPPPQPLTEALPGRSSLDFGFTAPEDVRHKSPRPSGTPNSIKNLPVRGPSAGPMQQSTSVSDFNRPPRTTSMHIVNPPKRSFDEVARPPSVAQTATPAPQVASPPPKKGPKTFDEMGVPAGKQENECVSFVLISSIALLVLTLE